MHASAEHPRCPVCSAENSRHASVCVSCGSFIQNRVPTLDLFSTAWGIIEHPVRTFHVIARAEHKNYAVFLFALGGILPTMVSLHAFAMGRFFPSLLVMLPLGLVLGMVLGSLMAPFGAGIIAMLSKLLGGDGSYRNALGAASYALVPTIIMAIITLPIQWLTFGEYQFTLNPHPETINLVSYWALNILQWGAAGWTFVLLVQGVRISMRLGKGKALGPSGGMVLILAGGWALAFSAAVTFLQTAQVYYVY